MEADATLKVNILDFREHHYEGILPVIMDKIRCDKRKEVHARLDFRESPKKSQRAREGSQKSSAGTVPARYRYPSERPKMQDRLRYNDENVFDRLGPDRANSRDRCHSRGCPRRRDSSPSRDHPRRRDLLRGIKESYGNNFRDRDRSRSIKRGRESESPLSRVSESGTSDGGHWKSNSKRGKPTGEEDLEVPWSCEEVDPFTHRIRSFISSQKTRMPNNVKTYDETEDPEDYVKIFQAAA
nr:reverse transcriptase domain-containing protein [Tanacetum cinerariifolium]